MKSELFLRIIGDIDDDLITEAAQERRFSPRFVRIMGGIAACFVLAAALVIAAPLLTRTMHDRAPMENEAVMDAAGDFWFTADEYKGKVENWIDADGADKAQTSSTSGSAAGSVSGNTPAETVHPTAMPETGSAETSADTALPQPLMGWTFYFYDGKTWRTDTKTYPGGVPSMQNIVNDYLSEAGVKVTCTGARSEVVGEKDEVKNGIVTHTVGVRTWYITLDGAVTDAQFRGLVNTVLESASPSKLYLVQADTPAGTMGPAQASRIG